jgi:hypothetical protein
MFLPQLVAAAKFLCPARRGVALAKTGLRLPSERLVGSQLAERSLKPEGG